MHIVYWLYISIYNCNNTFNNYGFEINNVKYFVWRWHYVIYKVIYDSFVNDYFLLSKHDMMGETYNITFNVNIS